LHRRAIHRRPHDDLRLLLSHTVKEIVKGGEGFEVSGTSHGTPFSFRARKVILATNLNSLAKFPILAGLPLFKQLAMSPLIRIYAVYPTPVWFCGLKKTVTTSKLRYVIPINEETGLIMVSYTDGADTDYWRALEGQALEDAIQSELQALFSDKHIPRPTYLEKHDWKDGCTYWKPGDYDVEAASRAAHAPLPNLYICGESISLQQAWMEGALESAHTLLDILT
jgi:monoamine oxidase